MKSEERHQLQTNELKKVAHQVSDLLKSTWWDKYQNHVLMGITAVALILAGWIYWSRRAAAFEMNAWMAYTEAERSSSQMKDVGSSGSDYTASAAAPWALLRSAEMNMAEGFKSAFTNKEASQTELKSAQETLEELLSRSGLSAEVRERGVFLQARCLEALGKTDDAVEAYQAFAKSFSDSIYAPDAARRLASLKTKEGQEFYAWFAKQKPAPPALPAPKDGKLVNPHGDMEDSKDPLIDLENTPLEPEKTVPEKTAPEKSVPGKALPAPDKSAPEKTAPEKTEPGKTLPEGTAPEKTDPAKPPEKTLPEKTDAEKKPETPPTKPEPEKTPEKKPEPEKTPEPEKKPDAPAAAPEKPAEKSPEKPADAPK